MPSSKKKKKVHSMWFYLPRTLEKFKVIYSDQKQLSSCLAGGEDKEG